MKYSCGEYRNTHNMNRVLVAGYRCKVQLDTSQHTTFLDVIRIVATGCNKGQMFVAVSHTYGWLHADTKRV